MKKENVIAKQSCHSRGMLSGIYNACRCPKKEKTLLNNCVEDPRLQISGMTPNLMGFTLIELLVVVLIIGILAAVALPQYKKAVEKSRLSVYMPVVKALAQAEEAYYLANGDYTYEFDKLDIDLPVAGCTHITSDQYGQFYRCLASNNALFNIGVWDGPTNAQFQTDNLAYLQFFKDFTSGDIEFKKGDIACYSKDTTSRSICKSLGQGTEYAYDTTTGWKWKYVLGR